MNRAWIPAGALAGVSVAGLIALGPLTDSLGTQVSFPSSLTVESQPNTANPSAPVALKINEGTVGGVHSSPAVSQRGGQAGATPTSPVSGDSGAVGYRIPPSTHSTTHTTTTNAPAAKPKKPKTTKRASSIGSDSGPNSSSGLASGANSGSSNVGATSGTPGPDNP
jgi:hypothetical protein